MLHRRGLQLVLLAWMLGVSVLDFCSATPGENWFMIEVPLLGWGYKVGDDAAFAVTCCSGRGIWVLVIPIGVVFSFIPLRRVFLSPDILLLQISFEALLFYEQKCPRNIFC